MKEDKIMFKIVSRILFEMQKSNLLYINLGQCLFFAWSFLKICFYLPWQWALET